MIRFLSNNKSGSTPPVDENLKPENIRLGTSIYGVKGNYYGDEFDGLSIKDDGNLHANDDILSLLYIDSEYISGTIDDLYYDGHNVMMTITYFPNQDKGIIPVKFYNWDKDLGYTELDTSVTEQTTKNIKLEYCKISDMIKEIMIGINEEEIRHYLDEYTFETYIDDVKVDNSKLHFEEFIEPVIIETSVMHKFTVRFEEYYLEDENMEQLSSYIELVLSDGSIIKGDYNFDDNYQTYLKTYIQEGQQVETIRLKFDRDILYQKTIEFVSKFDENVIGSLDIYYNTKDNEDISTSIWITNESFNGDIVVLKDDSDNIVIGPFEANQLNYIMALLTSEKVKSISKVDYYWWNTEDELRQLPLQDNATWNEDTKKWERTFIKENMFTCKIELQLGNTGQLHVEFDKDFNLIENAPITCVVAFFGEGNYYIPISSYVTDENGVRYNDSTMDHSFIFACIFATDIYFYN